MLNSGYQTKGFKMTKVVSHIKNHKKAYLLGTIGVLVIAGLAVAAWNCPCVQFKRYCKEKELCACAAQKLSSEQKKTFVTIAKYMKETGKAELDAGILKYTSAEDLAEVGLKMKSCTADIARQAMLDNNAANRANFPGDYNCMRQTLMNELSNEEILFLQSPQSKNLTALQSPALRDMYLTSSAKLMKCMNEQIQKQYMAELEKIKEVSLPKKKAKKKIKPTEDPAPKPQS